jgi:hypothetical protein
LAAVQGLYGDTHALAKSFKNKKRKAADLPLNLHRIVLLGLLIQGVHRRALTLQRIGKTPKNWVLYAFQRADLVYKKLFLVNKKSLDYKSNRALY